MSTRRAFLTQAGAASVAAVTFTDRALDVVQAAGSAAGSTSAVDMAMNEDYWREIQGAFTLDRTMVNLNNGGVCPSPRVVMDAMKRYLDQSNLAPSFNMWQQIEPGIEGVRRDLAAEFGCDPEEMAITRNASESLEICILGLDLKPGDEILTTNQDYPRMITAWKQRERRDGVVLKQISFPVPAP
ncbi:MAG: aminotransferase class V-fold PLP-dependent enzyme, partial [Vicinamibacteria bacterium]